MNDLELQRIVTRSALDASGTSGFALAGSGAIREHGVISRMSQDIDLFTSNTNEGAFGSTAPLWSELAFAAQAPELGGEGHTAS